MILASNSTENIDAAFAKRFRSVINFKMPSATERYQLWKNALTETIKLNDEVDLHQISEQHELSGGSITNVIRYCAISSLKRNNSAVNLQELLAGIKRESKH